MFLSSCPSIHLSISPKCKSSKDMIFKYGHVLTWTSWDSHLKPNAEKAEYEKSMVYSFLIMSFQGPLIPNKLSFSCFWRRLNQMWQIIVKNALLKCWFQCPQKKCWFQCFFHCFHYRLGKHWFTKQGIHVISFYWVNLVLSNCKMYFSFQNSDVTSSW